MATEGAHIGDYDALVLPDVTGEAVRVLRAFGFAGTHIVVIGGLVPSLLVPVPDDGLEPHVGTRDLDLCLTIALVNGEVGEYERLEHSLRRAGFSILGGESWRWHRQGPVPITVEFFCAPGPRHESPGRLFRPGGVVGGKLSAMVIAAARLIDRDTIDVTVDVDLPDGGGRTAHVLKVAGPAAFLASKADALRGRDNNKDAYDVVWLLESWPGGQAALADRIASSPIVMDLAPTIDILRQEFADIDASGAVRYGRFLERSAGAVDHAARRAVGAVAAFLDELRTRLGVAQR